MKIKHLHIFLVIFIVLLLSFSGCKTSPEDRPLIPVHEFDVDTIEQALSSEIKWAYDQKLSNEAAGESPVSPEELFISWYYGNFGGCEVVMIGGDGIQHTAAHRPVEVAGYTIVFASGEPVWVYKDGQFFTVKEAYDTGVISKSVVCEIGEKVDRDFASRNQISGENVILCADQTQFTLSFDDSTYLIDLFDYHNDDIINDIYKFHYNYSFIVEK